MKAVRTGTVRAARGYARLRNELHAKAQLARSAAGRAVNRELVLLYWLIGRRIMASRHLGTKVIDRLAEDLGRAFPDMRGFSPRNLEYMRRFARAWPGEEDVQQFAANIPWSHNCVLLDRVRKRRLRRWYAHVASEFGWSLNELVQQIEADLYRHRATALANFEELLFRRMLEPHEPIVKDPYNLDFLGLTESRGSSPPPHSIQD
jgi:predicted nuclease of restriction endonuclease-like (RecB) superfamily